MLIDFQKTLWYNQENLMRRLPKIIMEELLKLLDENLKYMVHEIMGDTIMIYAESEREEVRCPYCGECSNRVHSRYLRKIQDLPMQGKKSKIVLRNKKYFCANENCTHKTFAEVFSFFEPKATKTKRLQEEILRISLTQSSLSAEKYLRRSVAEVGKSTICNLLKKTNNHS